MSLDMSENVTVIYNWRKMQMIRTEIIVTPGK